MKPKITPRWVTDLEPNQIFVFGSNLSGIHGAGAAKLAMKWGAEYGVGEGLRGQTYALPTVQEQVAGPLTIKQIEAHVNRFLDVVEANPDLEFLLTEVGCGLCGYTPEDIAPLFERGLKYRNLWFPHWFREILLPRSLH